MDRLLLYPDEVEIEFYFTPGVGPTDDAAAWHRDFGSLELVDDRETKYVCAGGGLSPDSRDRAWGVRQYVPAVPEGATVLIIEAVDRAGVPLGRREVPLPS